HWREGRSRSEPERGEAARVRAGARAVLPAGRYAAECARGASFGLADVLRELDTTTPAAPDLAPAEEQRPASGR
ncbi:hypothetical protein GT045_12005, partial [Streptomyces sp. SID486]|uniref:hypothetical protein n=2 Tax=unclassified Streptomyces TaxID=2593676 RepID=UPI001368C7FE